MVSKTLFQLRRLYYSWLLLWSAVTKKCNAILITLSSFSCVTILVLLGLEISFHLADINTSLFYRIHLFFLTFFCVDVCLHFFIIKKNRWTVFLHRPTDLLALFPLVFLFSDTALYSSFFVTQSLLFFIVLGRLSHLNLILTWLKVRPAQLIILAFLFIIFIGSLLLSLPVATSTGIPLSFIDALFTACSAVCVTGLVVNNVGQDFSVFGQSVILGLIQIGGLGIMSFSVLLSILFKKKLSQADSVRLQENYETVTLKETLSAILFIFKFTLFFELVGALLLGLAWYNAMDSWAKTAYYALFHSISAFCNAGFSLFQDSLVGYFNHWPTVLVISALIILGGLGFPVLINLAQRFSSPGHRTIKMQTKLALSVTLGLLVFGTLLIYFNEQHHSLAGLAFGEQLQLSFFQSVTARTAGFNTMDLSLFKSSTIMVLLGMMVIGASPGSTGGGIKTTTFGLIMIAFWNSLKSSFRFDFDKRTIDVNSIFKAFATLFTAVLLISLFCFILFQTEDASVQAILFEVASAFGTVGLSLGLTSDLTVIGKWGIIMLMFIGRIGPFTFLYAFVKQSTSKPYAYPIEKVNIV